MTGHADDDAPDIVCRLKEKRRACKGNARMEAWRLYTDAIAEIERLRRASPAPADDDAPDNRDIVIRLRVAARTGVISHSNLEALLPAAADEIERLRRAPVPADIESIAEAIGLALPYATKWSENTPERRAMCLHAARKAVAVWGGSPMPGYAAGRIAGLEEAAKVADADAESWRGKNADRYWQSRRIDHAIRALIAARRATPDSEE